MSRAVIASLHEWTRKRRAKNWESVRSFAQNVELDKPHITLRKFECHVWQTTVPAGQAVAWDWRPNECEENADREEVHVVDKHDRGFDTGARELRAMARCRVVAFNGEIAECVVLLDGLELPRVSFPAWIIKHKKLEVGGRFIWIMREGSRVRLADIDPDVPQSDGLTVAEQAELDRLYDEFKRGRHEDGGEWPEFTGPGR